MATVKDFYENSPKEEKLKVTRFYYNEEDAWLCTDCFHAGTNFILATIPCERCEKGTTRMSIGAEESGKYARP